MEGVFAERLKEAITERNIKPAELADAVGLTVKTIYAFMQGRIFPSLDKFDKIAEALDVSSDYLLGKVDHLKGIIVEDPNDPMVPEVLFMRRAYHEASEHERGLILRLINAVLEGRQDGTVDIKRDFRLVKSDKGGV